MADPQTSEAEKPTGRSIYRWVRMALLFLSLILCLLLSLCYWRRWDAVAAVTFLPPWLWLVPGLFLTAMGYSRRTRAIMGGVLLLWLLFALLFVEEARSLPRIRSWPARGWTVARAEGKALRVISLNCAGSELAAGEVGQFNPDVVLLQESPSRHFVETLARRLFGADGAAVWGIDTSIVAHGRVLAASRCPDRREFFVRATLRLSCGLDAEVYSLRLVPPIVRADLWTAGCWRTHAEMRRIRREELAVIARHIMACRPAFPLIVGGDFNAPAGDAITCLLQPRLHDTFREAGLGWGSTGLNDLPVSRIDQVWTSDRLQAAGVVAIKTKYSDHRMVVCDLLVKP